MSLGPESEAKSEKLDALKRKLIFFTSRTRSFKTVEMVVTERSILEEVIAEHQRKGRSLYLSDSRCKRERCDKFNDRCTPCIKSYWLVENPEEG